MKFTIEKDVFVKALQKIQGIVEKRNTMPILSNVLIEAEDDTLTFIATDLEVGMKSSYPAQITEKGKITISAKKLYEIIREFSEENVHLSTRDNNWVDISCGKAKFNIVGLSPEEFPFFPKINEDILLSFNSEELSTLIELTAYAICNDETKYNLNGIFFKLSNEDNIDILRLVATDGHRLCVADQKFDKLPENELLEKGVILPKKGIIELKKLCDEEQGNILLGFIDNSAAIIKGNTTVIMRLVDGEFPDYTRVVPTGNTKEIIINREKFLHSLKRMAILSSEKYKGIKFDINDSLVEISSSNPDFGEAREEVEVSYNGDKVTTRFNARYLIDVLNVLSDDEIMLLLRDEMSPAILKPATRSGFISVVMPMRL